MNKKIGDSRPTVCSSQGADALFQALGIPHDIDAFLKTHLPAAAPRTRNRSSNAWSEIRAGL